MRQSRYAQGKRIARRKEKESVKEFNLVKGLVVCTLSGILSACFNYGIEAGTPMAEKANEIWKAANPTATTEFLYQNNVIYIVLLWGGLTTNFIWCMILNARNKSFGDYTNKSAPLKWNYIFSALAGTIWFMQFFFYGMGKADSAMEQVLGFCTWLSSSWSQISGEFYCKSGMAQALKQK